MVKGYGADEIVLMGANYIEKVGKMKVDVVLDMVAGDQWHNYLKY